MDASTKKLLTYAIGAIACLAIGTAIGWNLSKGGAKQSHINLKFGNNQLEVKLDQAEIDAESFLGNMFEKDFSKSGVVNWLKSNQKIFHFEDPLLVDEIKNLSPDHIVSEHLFKLSTQKQGPWSYQIDTVRISIPEKKYQPRKGTVNVCENGKYRGRQLKIYNMDQSFSLDVHATGKYACPPNYTFPDLQLHAKDAASILGYSNFSKYEEAIVLIVQE